MLPPSERRGSGKEEKEVGPKHDADIAPQIGGGIIEGRQELVATRDWTILISTRAI